MSQTDTSHDRCPASSPARLQTKPTSLHLAHDSLTLPCRKYIRESSRPTSKSLPPRAKNQCPPHKLPSPIGSSQRQLGPLSSETIPAPTSHTSVDRAAPSYLHTPGRCPAR